MPYLFIRIKLMSDINLQDAVLIDCSFTGCGGTRTIADGKIIVDEKAIDAQGVTSKKLQWFPSEALSFKDKHNKRIKRYFDTIGIPTPLGIVIDKSKLREAEIFIESEKAQFFEAVELLCDSYEVTLEQHAIGANQKAGNERIGKIIKMVAMTKDDFRNTFKMTSMPPLVLSATSDEGAQEFSQILTDGALQRLIETASKLFNKSFLGKEKTTEAATKATFKLKDMVFNLSFANNALAYVADQFTEVLDGINSQTEHSGKDFYAMRSFVSELSTEESLLALMKGERSESDEETESPELDVSEADAESCTQPDTTTQTVDETQIVDEAETASEAPETATVNPVVPSKANTPSEDITVTTEENAKTVIPGKLQGFGNF